MSSRLNRKYLTAKTWGSYLQLFTHPPAELYSTPGYLHPLEGRFLYWLAGKVPPGGLAVEIGSFKGKSSVFLAAGLQANARLACVDTWRNDAMPYDDSADTMPLFLTNVSRYSDRIETNRGKSVDVANKWHQPIDVLFIDGDHSYEGCSTDMKAWMRFVRTGGWIAFHDSGEAGVIRAINEFFPRTCRGVELYAGSILAVKKTKATE